MDNVIFGLLTLNIVILFGLYIWYSHIQKTSAYGTVSRDTIYMELLNEYLYTSKKITEIELLESEYNKKNYDNVQLQIAKNKVQEETLLFKDTYCKFNQQLKDIEKRFSDGSSVKADVEKLKKIKYNILGVCGRIRNTELSMDYFTKQLKEYNCD